jgi:hypothetical protein
MTVSDPKPLAGSKFICEVPPGGKVWLRGDVVIVVSPGAALDKSCMSRHNIFAHDPRETFANFAQTQIKGALQVNNPYQPALPAKSGLAPWLLCQSPRSTAIRISPNWCGNIHTNISSRIEYK